MSHDLTVSAPQAIYLNGLNTKFRGFVGGFGSGKTFVGCLDLALFAGAHPKVTQGYFAPTYRDIRDTFWPTMDEAASMLGFRVRIKTSDKEVELYRGRSYYGTIICRSMDDPSGIVGFKIARANVDEIDVLSKEKAQNAWRKIIARMRLVVPGVVNGIGVTTTPEGFRFVYDTFKRDPKPDYSMVQASTYENEAYLPPDYIQSLRDTYPAELIEAYLMGEFVNLTSGTVYRNYDRISNRSAETIREGEPLHIGQDFNVNNMASVVCVHRPLGIDGKGTQAGYHAVAELTGGVDTPSTIATIKEKWPTNVVYMYPDASGNNTSSKSASVSDIGLLRQAGFKIRAKDSNPRVKDRILAKNTAFAKHTFWVNDVTCKTYAEGLEQQAYDKNGEPDKTTGHDHTNDGGGYFVVWTMPVIKPVFTRTGLGL